MLKRNWLSFEMSFLINCFRLTCPKKRRWVYFAVAFVPETLTELKLTKLEVFKVHRIMPSLLGLVKFGLLHLGPAVKWEV